MFETKNVYNANTSDPYFENLLVKNSGLLRWCNILSRVLYYDVNFKTDVQYELSYKWTLHHTLVMFA